jgi:hypothetical protein
MFAGCWQIMRVYSHLIRVERIGYWQLIQAEKEAVCRSCDLCLQAVTANYCYSKNSSESLQGVELGLSRITLFCQN